MLLNCTQFKNIPTDVSLDGSTDTSRVLGHQWKQVHKLGEVVCQSKDVLVTSLCRWQRTCKKIH